MPDYIQRTHHLEHALPKTNTKSTKTKHRKHETENVRNHQQIILSSKPQNFINEHVSYLSMMET